MKTLIESIRDRRGYRPGRDFGVKDLKSGYVVRYRGEHRKDLGMYFSYDAVKSDKYFDSRSGIIRTLNHEGGFFADPDASGGPNWMPLNRYENNLTHRGGDTSLDIIEVYPINTAPKMLFQNQLEDLIRGIIPIEINPI